MINTNQGQKLLQKLIVSGKIIAYAEKEEYAIKGNVALRHCVFHPEHETFMNDVAILDHYQLQNKYFNQPFWKRLFKTFIPIRLKAYWTIRKKNRSC